MPTKSLGGTGCLPPEQVSSEDDHADRHHALGRLKARLNQDDTSVLSDYAGNATRVTDETGKQRLTQTDGLGRLTKVCEVTAGNARSPAGSCDITGFGGSGYLTTISRTQSSSENVKEIVQGAQTRTLRHDKLGRIKSAKIIEVNTATEVTYGYDNDGDQTAVTDPRGTVIFEYDELHRLKRKRHGTTVVASYSYDGSQANNAVGRLITDTDGDFGSGADKTDYTYDAMSRVKTANRTVSGTTYAMSYSYDYLGDLTELNYPSASGTRRKVQYTYNANAELNQVTDITGTAFDYVTGASYSPLGTLGTLDLGNSVRTTLTWNNREALSSLVTQKVGGNSYLSLSYSRFSNAQIQQIINSLDSLKSEKFTYDELYRLLTAQRGPDDNIQRKYSYDYDRYGNRWEQKLIAGTQGYNPQHGFNSADNRVNSPSGFSYDNSGNLTANGPGTSYTYNQENLMTAAGTSTYQYDAQGRRVRKTVGGTITDYFYSGGVVVSEKEGANWTDYIFFGGQRIAKQTGSSGSTVTYIHTDHLSSTRVCTNSSGNSTGTCDYEPFGEVQPGAGCSVPVNYRFAGMEWDDVGGHGLYHTWFRQYDPSQGRWMSVDPLPGSPDDPQSLDRYLYVLNDAVNLTDPLGLQVCTWDGIQVPCSWVREALASGAGVVAPEGPDWVDTPNDPGCKTNLAMDVKWCPRDPMSSLPFPYLSSVPTEEPVEPPEPEQERNAKKIAYNECLKEFGLALSAADFLGYYGLASTAVNIATTAGLSLTQKLAGQTATNLERKLAPMAQSFGLGVGEITFIDNPGSLVKVLSKARFLRIIAGQLSKTSGVVAAVATGASLGIRGYCRVKARTQ